MADLTDLAIPPEIKMEMSQLRIGVFCGKNMAAMDTGLFQSDSKACDPYVKVNFGTQTIQTKVQKNTTSPGSHNNYEQCSKKCCTYL